MTPARNTPADAGGGDVDDGGAGDAADGDDNSTRTVASAVAAAPGGAPTTADGGGAGGRSPGMTTSRNRNWSRSSLAGTWRRNRATVRGGPPLDHLW